MDKFSQKKIKKSIEEILPQAHLGHLNGKEIETRIIVSPRRLPLPDNIMVFQAFAYLAATKLTTTAIKILMLFFSKSAYENYIGMDIKTIAEDLKMKERMVIYALKELTEHNIIIKTKYVTDRRRNDYFINPLAAWRGNSFTRKRSIKKLEENKNQLDIFGNTPAQMEKAKQEQHSLLSMSEKKLPLAERK